MVDWWNAFISLSHTFWVAALRMTEHTRICWRYLTALLLLYDIHLEDASSVF
jgi:hypothetical protein